MATTSKNLLGATELTVVADIKPGLVPIAEPTTYATRLRLLLELLFVLRKKAIEFQNHFAEGGPLEGLRSLHRVHWSILEERKLILTVGFDGPWEPYIRRIVDVAGPLLDVIFCHCAGYEKHSCFDGYAQFAEWVRQNQQPTNFFYAGSPELTVDDVRYLQRFESEFAKSPLDFEKRAARLTVPKPTTTPEEGRFKDALAALSRLRRHFPPSTDSDPSQDEFFYARAVALVLKDLAPPPGAPPSDPRELALLQWAMQALKQLGTPSPSDQRIPQYLDPEATASVQGNILTGYEGLTHGCLVLARFTRSAAASLKSLTQEITTEDKAKANPDIRFNLALTYCGLSTLGMPEEQLQLLPQEFRDGMEARAGMLGDTGRDHPDAWQQPIFDYGEGDGQRIALSTVDLVIQLQTTGQDLLDPKLPAKLADKIKTLESEHGLHVLHVQPLFRIYDQSRRVREHFGLVDGLSQPVPQLDQQPSGLAGDRVALGEILLGYKNERGEPRPNDSLYRLPIELLRDSTFLVVRKLAQDVGSFRELPDEQVARLLGRDAQGNNLVTGKDGNDFGYAQENGDRCPHFAHIRRTNPRTSEDAGVGGMKLRTPRILRRGFSYGSRFGAETKDEARGLVFMAYNASIADQFEVTQRWVNGGNSSGGYSGHPDLMAGNFLPEQARSLSYVADDGSVQRIPLPEQPYVKLEWGVYLFVPSLKAIDYLVGLGRGPGLPAADPMLGKARMLVTDLVLRAKDRGQRKAVKQKWKSSLEDNLVRPLSRAIWEVIRKDYGGVLDTNTESGDDPGYGVLIGSEEGVSKVLVDHKTFSVHEYYQRMADTFGVHYLGMDPEPKSPPLYVREVEGKYQEQSAINAYLRSITFEETFVSARRRTREFFEQPRAVKRVEIGEISRLVISGIASEWFGLPDGEAMTNAEEAVDEKNDVARCPLDFQRISQYVFHPHPSPVLERVAKARGAKVKEAVQAASGRCPAALKEALDKYPKLDKQQALTGSINGFSVPTSGSFLSVMYQWIDSPVLLSMQRWLHAPENELRGKLLQGQPGLDDVKDTALFAAMIRAMVGLSVPDLLHRTVVRPTELGGVDLEPNHRVVISLASAAAAQMERRARERASGAAGGAADSGRPEPIGVPLLFGEAQAEVERHDKHVVESAIHACPGQPMAYGTMLGMIVAILDQKNLRRFGRGVLTFD